MLFVEASVSSGESGHRRPSWLALGGVLDGYSDHAFALYAAPSVAFAGPCTAPVSLIHFDDYMELIPPVAILHGLANLMLYQPCRGVADADLLHQLHRRDALFVVAPAVDRPEPTGQRRARLMKDRSRRHRALIAAQLALMHPPRGDVAARTAAATWAAKPLRPTLPTQLLGALRLLAKLGAKLAHRQHPNTLAHA